jgi:hypothetical protein
MTMAFPVLVIGPSGSGKTYSLKNFDPASVGILSIEKGRLPFDQRNVPDDKKLKVIKVKSFNDNEHSPAQANAAKYSWIMSVIKNAKTKSVVIDDSQYLLSGEFFDRAYEKGYDKFTDIAAKFRNLIHFINELPEDDKIVYFLHHSDISEDGRAKVKTVGKMLDEKLVVEGCFDVVLYCQDQKFFTQSNGQSTAKTPEGMFDLEIPNDLKAVDDAIRDYYGINVKKTAAKKTKEG